MRRFLASLTVILSCLSLFAPLAARAEAYNCYCNAPNGTCEKRNTVDTPDQATAIAQCTAGCSQNQNPFCKAVKASEDKPKAAGCEGRTVCLTNPLNSENIPQLVSNVIKAAVSFVGALALLVFVYGGFLWLTSGGEAGKIQQGKDAMKWALVGLAVVFSSYALVSFVLSALTTKA